MTDFTVHTIETAPPGARPLLESTKRAWGFVPSLHGVLAESPATLEAYDVLFALAEKTALPPPERQLVYLAVSVFHGCEYCVAGHTHLAGAAGLDATAIAALRAGAPIPDPKLQALRAFAEAVVRERGHAGTALERLLASGYSRAEALDVLLIVATKTISNYANHLARTPKESFMADPAVAWTAPGRATA
ncbi:carboxymuconolactone decarboxylase family protein [Salinarimonas chemoclinalis]|uniref:carboxymuconolactone decarboxylase family protein n=1 Tax=Salinarimonas chemoclinalis TaxID=3241599 RepID=UPI003556E876